jgi:hypothetical protein
MPTSSKAVLDSLSKIDDILEKIEGKDLETAAHSRQLVQDLIVAPTIALEIRQSITDRLNQINLLLALKTIESEESY